MRADAVTRCARGSESAAGRWRRCRLGAAVRRRTQPKGKTSRDRPASGRAGSAYQPRGGGRGANGRDAVAAHAAAPLVGRAERAWLAGRAAARSPKTRPRGRWRRGRTAAAFSGSSRPLPGGYYYAARAYDYVATTTPRGRNWSATTTRSLLAASEGSCSSASRRWLRALGSCRARPSSARAAPCSSAWPRASSFGAARTCVLPSTRRAREARPIGARSTGAGEVARRGRPTTGDGASTSAARAPRAAPRLTLPPPPVGRRVVGRAPPAAEHARTRRGRRAAALEPRRRPRRASRAPGWAALAPSGSAARAAAARSATEPPTPAASVPLGAELADGSRGAPAASSCAAARIRSVQARRRRLPGAAARRRRWTAHARAAVARPPLSRRGAPPAFSATPPPAARRCSVRHAARGLRRSTRGSGDSRESFDGISGSLAPGRAERPPRDGRRRARRRGAR